MKIYSVNPGEAAGAKYAKKKKRVHTRKVVERQHRKAARQESRHAISNLENASPLATGESDAERSQTPS